LDSSPHSERRCNTLSLLHPTGTAYLLLGLQDKPAKRGPASTLQRQIEQISLMPRAKQKFIAEMLDALIKQQQATAQG